MGKMYVPSDELYLCTKPPRAQDTVLGDIVVIYSAKSQISGDRTFGGVWARWNGIEWRTDDFGISVRPNIFDNPDNIPMYWKVVPNALSPKEYSK